MGVTVPGPGTYYIRVAAYENGRLVAQSDEMAVTTDYLVDVTADKAKLTAKLAEATSLDTESFTIESLDRLQKSIKFANDVLSNSVKANSKGLPNQMNVSLAEHLLSAAISTPAILDIPEELEIVITKDLEDLTFDYKEIPEGAKLEVETSSHSVTYAWHQAEGVDEDGKPINGKALELDDQTSVFSIPQDLAIGDYWYYALLEAPYSADGVLSKVAKVSILPTHELSFETQPESLAVPAHDTAQTLTSLAVTDPEGPEVKYQWHLATALDDEGLPTDGAPVDSATEPSIKTPADLAVGAYYYYVIASAEGAIDKASDIATLEVSESAVIEIKEEPVSAELYLGESVQLSVVASSSSNKALTYQWHDETGPIEGATEAIYEYVPALLGEKSFYANISSVDAISVSSATATIKTLKPEITVTSLQPSRPR
jgi:hypothetical protein